MLQDSAATIAGCLFYPDDETGDAHAFCLALADSLASRSVEVEFGVDVQSLLVRRAAVIGVATSAGDLRADSIVVAAGVWTPALLKTVGTGARIMPVKGYSLDIAAQSASALPRIPLIDDEIHAAVAPIGRRLRLAGTAEFCGWDRSLDPARIDNLWRSLERLSPSLSGAIDRSSAQPWCGFRPMSSDGIPFVGAAGPDGLFINAGHGHLGWTQAAGSGALLADLITGTAPDIDARPFDPTR